MPIINTVYCLVFYRLGELKEKVGPEMAVAMPKVKEEHEVTSELPEIVAPAGDEEVKEEVSDTLWLH